MADSDQAMRDYYRTRAPVYERVYGYPERQADLRWLEKYLPGQFDGQEVLEVAAGTGYWTEQIARRARTVTATDVTIETLDQIDRQAMAGSIQIQVADAYHLEELKLTFDAAFAGLWFSHIELDRRTTFLDSLHAVLRPGATVILLDNSDAQCQRLPISYRDPAGNTFQDRLTDDGASHRVLKNFPTEEELRGLVADVAVNVRFESLENYWLLQYQLG